ncbi:MAG TPA: carbohydrate ABC transporter permease, partial [Roseiflexaceae bacterium]|nr:carbohydrate ABC transporter permease [Roseiflexaceae bacterium]
MATSIVSETQQRRAKFHPSHIPLHIALILGSVVMLLPFVWMLSTSLKRPPDVFAYPPIWIPKPIAWDNYARTISAMPFGRFYLNSAIVTICVTVLQIIISSLAAFAFARLQFRGRNVLFLLYLATLMIPFQVTMIPNFIVLTRFLHWY